MKTEAGLALARAAFEQARPGYHPITTASVEKVIAEARPAPSPAPPAAPQVQDEADADAPPAG